MRVVQLLSVARAGILLVLLGSSVVPAQTVTGSVTGTVLDPSGAAVPGASVAAINAATGVRTPTTSNADGVYSIRFLPIGVVTEASASSIPSTDGTLPANFQGAPSIC